jgi:hypothetical protein
VAIRQWTGEEFLVPRGDLVRFERRDGSEWKRGALVGAGLGAVLGFVVGLGTGTEGPDGSGDKGSAGIVALATLGFGVTSAAAGYAIGNAIPRWEPIAVEWLTAALGPTPSGMGIHLRIGF